MIGLTQAPMRDGSWEGNDLVRRRQFDMKTLSIKNLDDLAAFARETTTKLKGGEVIGLVGDLGAGKTTFTQMLAGELGVEETVKSPTFVLMQIHVTGRHLMERGIVQLCHVDAYRVESEAELFGIGLAEYLNDPQTLTVIEWADRVPSLRELPNYSEYKFRFGKGEERLIDVRGDA